MIELLLLLPFAVAGWLVWRRKGARLDALLMAHAVTALTLATGRPVRVAGSGGWFVARLDADGAVALRRFGRETAARAAAQALATAGTPTCFGALELSEYLPLEEAGADMLRAVEAFCATAPGSAAAAMSSAGAAGDPSMH